MTSEILSLLRARRARLLMAGVLAVSIPAVLLAACHAEDADGCDALVDCVETCGGPVVTVGCNQCPNGLIDGTRIRCGKTCDDPAPLEVCDWECPEGLIDLDRAEWLECVEQCDGPSVATVCSPVEACPAGSFDDSECNLYCASPLRVCLDHCGGEVLDLLCEPCSGAGLVDRADCVVDAGADGN
jgi:hypothetical protein